MYPLASVKTMIRDSKEFHQVFVDLRCLFPRGDWLAHRKSPKERTQLLINSQNIYIKRGLQEDMTCVLFLTCRQIKSYQRQVICFELLITPKLFKYLPTSIQVCMFSVTHISVLTLLQLNSMAVWPTTSKETTLGHVSLMQMIDY